MIDIRKEYPIITKLFYDYTTSDEYLQNDLTWYVDSKSTEMHKAAIALVQDGHALGATDMMMSACVEYEHAGFIFGFTYALNLMKETQLIKQ